MSSPDTPERDLVDELLTVEGPTGVDRIRPRLMAQTASVVRRRRTVRRLAVVVALAGCYLAGIATVQVFRGFPARPSEAVAEMSEVLQEGPSPAEPPRQREREVPAPAEEKEPAVAQTEFDAIRLAGDRRLHEEGDPLAALRDYSRALDHASAEDLALSYEEDSFLLAALKLARIEENQDDNDGT